jgi:peptidoglycan/LPS O-acetylase OafA/YrhL
VIWALCFGCLFTAPGGLAGRALERLRRLLAHASLQWLGRISYPLYLVHWPLLVFSLAALLRAKPGLSYGEAALWLLLLGVPLMLGAAWLLHLWIEAPCMRLAKRLTASTARRPAPIRDWGVTGSDVSSWFAKRRTVSLTVQENMSAAEPRSD